MAISEEELIAIVSDALNEFYRRRIAKLSTLKLRHTLRRKNPYLFHAIGAADASEIVEMILSAFMSSSDEGIFGDAFFEPVAKAVSGGHVSPSEGVDIAIEKERAYSAVAVKSGPSVFNAQSRRRQNQDFQSLRNRLYRLQKHFEAIVGYAYGRKISEPNESKIFRELSGQAFWAVLTGEKDFYIRIIEAMKSKPQEHKVQYQEEWIKAKNRFVAEFTQEFCLPSGEIDWRKIVEFNSGCKDIKGVMEDRSG